VDADHLQPLLVRKPAKILFRDCSGIREALQPGAQLLIPLWQSNCGVEPVAKQDSKEIDVLPVGVTHKDALLAWSTPVTRQNNQDVLLLAKEFWMGSAIWLGVALQLPLGEQGLKRLWLCDRSSK